MFRKIFISATVLCTFCTFCMAQDITDAAEQAAKAMAEASAPESQRARPNYWTTQLTADLGFTSTGLTNWAAGGYNAMTLRAAMDAFANYSKNLFSWNNRLQMEYGFLYSEDKKGLIQKNNDRFYLQSTGAFKTNKNSKWNFTASFDFRSEMTEGYTYKTPEEGQSWRDAAILKSSLLSPAYSTLALGISWAPKPWFSINVAPLTGGFTICTSELLRKNYGMNLLSSNLDPTVGSNYSSAVFQFGAQVKTNFKLTINKVITYETQLIAFSNYLERPQDLRVNWDNMINWQIAKFIRISFNTWLIYDPKVMIVNEKHPDGAPMVQFKNYLAFNLTYTIKPR